MSVVSAMKPEAAPFVEAFRSRDSEPRWLAERREGALARFAELGFPTRRLEAWRFTDLRPLQKTPFPPAVMSGSVASALLDAPVLSGFCHRLVFANGRLAPELSDLGSLPDGAWLASTAVTLAARPELLERSFADATLSGQAFAALNAAFFRDGFVLALEPGVELEHPVEIVNLAEATSPQSLHLRSAILLGARSRARVLETFAGRGETWTNAVTTIALEEGASLSHVTLQDQGPEALHFLAAQTDLAARASYESFVLTLGARLSRHDGVVRLQGKGAQCSLNGAYLLRGQQEATHATVVDHAAPGATTRELWKGVADERAHGVFLGRIAVRPEAQQTDAQLENRNLLLSARAAIDTKPELEILADDVKCSHGATVGDLDEAALFYLRARGLGEAEARRMLIEAFAVDALASISDTMLREHLAARLRRWLDNRGQVAT